MVESEINKLHKFMVNIKDITDKKNILKFLLFCLLAISLLASIIYSNEYSYVENKMKNYLQGISGFLASVIVIAFLVSVFSENDYAESLSILILIIFIYLLSMWFIIVNSILIHNKKNIQEYEKTENTDNKNKVNINAVIGLLITIIVISLILLGLYLYFINNVKD